MSGPYVRKLPTEVRAGAKRVTLSWERGTHAVICTSREQAERVLADHNQAEIDRANDECGDWRGIGDAHGDGYSSLVDAARRTSDAIVAHQKGMDDFYDGQGDWESVWNAGHWLRTTLDAIQHGDGFREGERWFIERLLDLPEDPDAK